MNEAEYHMKNYGDRGGCYQPRPSAQLITLTSTLIVADISKTSFNNIICLLLTK